MWLYLGWFFTGLAFVGLALPLMPTVPFLLAAAYCFERGSPRLHYWLIHHPQLGLPLRDWQQHKVIRWPAKIIATAGLAVSLSYTCFFSDRPDLIKLMVGAIGLLAIAFILSRKSRAH